VSRTRCISLELSCRLTQAFVLHKVEGGDVGSQVQRLCMIVGGGFQESTSKNVTVKTRAATRIICQSNVVNSTQCRDRLGNLLHLLF
jgi:hypothetical protein